METERTFDILETYCFPRGCMLDGTLQHLLAYELLPKIKANGMTTGEWTRGALMLEDPLYTQVKSVVCRGCAIIVCPHNAGYGSQEDNLFYEILNWSYAERLDRNEELTEALLPASVIAEWATQGIEVKAYPSSSRTRFTLDVHIKHPTAGERHVSVYRKKGEAGEITISGAGYATHQLPRTPEDTSMKLREIINAL